MSPLDALKKDLLVLVIFVAAAVSIGFLFNSFRQNKLPLSYPLAEAEFGPSSPRAASPEKSLAGVSGGVLTLHDFQSFVFDKQGVVVDARSPFFYNLGHVPGAFNLPSDQFGTAYRRLKAKLEADKNRPIAVYCSSPTCEYSETVRQMLIRMGYTKVFRFGGGWSEWIQAGLPMSTSPES